MSIDIATEEVETLTELCKSLPKRRGGKRPNLCTAYRWTNEGVRGVRLDFIMVGGTRCSSRQALQRFFDALTALEQGRPAVHTFGRPSREKAIQAAEKRLEAAGI